ncbi:MAG: hypothetical protein KVP17_001703 [Porospora cf. gigantea B]|uniref:uncharacterized protein n=2 Tax=Porospora cf. gigantea B TaxID=2853592 RepID=UPI003571D59F|nr:MAG: hypothetical protein KVP17_001703 [Porospora cf. gigantea B]
MALQPVASPKQSPHDFASTDSTVSSIGFADASACIIHADSASDFVKQAAQHLQRVPGSFLLLPELGPNSDALMGVRTVPLSGTIFDVSKQTVDDLVYGAPENWRGMVFANSAVWTLGLLVLGAVMPIDMRASLMRRQAAQRKQLAGTLTTPLFKDVFSPQSYLSHRRAARDLGVDILSGQMITEGMEGLLEKLLKDMPHVPDDLRDLIVMMMKTDASERLRIKDLV